MQPAAGDPLLKMLDAWLFLAFLLSELKIVGESGLIYMIHESDSTGSDSQVTSIFRRRGQPLSASILLHMGLCQWALICFTQVLHSSSSLWEPRPP